MRWPRRTNEDLLMWWYTVELNGRPIWFGMTSLTEAQVREYMEVRYPYHTIGAITRGN